MFGGTKETRTLDPLNANLIVGLQNLGPVAQRKSLRPITEWLGYRDPPGPPKWRITMPKVTKWITYQK